MSSGKRKETHLSIDDVIKGGATQLEDDAVEATMRPSRHDFSKKPALCRRC